MRIAQICTVCILLSLLLVSGNCIEEGSNQVSIVIKENPRGKQINSLHFAVGVSFFMPGIYHGTLPANNPENKREEFAAALKKSGIKTLRFPKGNGCQYYVYEGWDASWEVKSDKGAFRGGGWHPDTRPEDNHYIKVYDFLRFCKDYDIDVIYQLPTLFYYDGKRSRAITNNDKVIKATRDDFYDHDRIEHAVSYIEPIVKFCKNNDIPVQCWEYGNEEFAHIAPGDFARIIKAYTNLLDKYYDNPSIAFALQGGPPETEDFEELEEVLAVNEKSKKKKHKWEWWPGWIQNLLAELTELGMKERLNRPEVSGVIHYLHGERLMPKTPEEKQSHTFYLNSDHCEHDNKTIGGRYAEVGYDRMSVAVTETNAAKNRMWNHLIINPSFAYALGYVQYWTSLLKAPKISAICHHNLETTFFGIMRYDVAFDAKTNTFIYLARLSNEERAQVPEHYLFDSQYVLSGAGYANAMLSELSGCRLDDMTITANGEAKKTLEDNQIGAVSGADENGDHIVVLYNKTAETFPVTLQFPSEKARKIHSLTSPSITSMFEKDLIIDTKELPPSNMLKISLPAYSVVAVEDDNFKKD